MHLWGTATFAVMITDSHAHIYSESYDEDQDAMMQRAIESGVHAFVVPAIDSTYTDRMYDIRSRYPDHVHLMMGLHPTHVQPESWKMELDHVQEQLDAHDFVAVGEIGIDLYWDQSTLAIQQEAFAIQIKWAQERNLPIAIHCRDAFDAVFQVLETTGPIAGVLHCFTGTHEQAQRCLNLGLDLGIGGVVTFKNGKIDKFLDTVPLERIHLETDAPYLAPVPYRGKRNEPSYITQVADKVAQVYNMDVLEVARITTANTNRLFKLS